MYNLTGCMNILWHRSDLDLTKEQIGVLRMRSGAKLPSGTAEKCKVSSMKKELEGIGRVRTLLLAELNANSDFRRWKKQKNIQKDYGGKKKYNIRKKERLLESGKSGTESKRLLGNTGCG